MGKELLEFSVRLDCLFLIHKKKKRAVAETLGCSRITISNYISARKCPSVERFMKICNEVGATDEEILHCLHAFKKS